jgi:hypothetical protein
VRGVQRRWCGFPEALLKTESVLVETYQEGVIATALALPHAPPHPNQSQSRWSCAQAIGALCSRMCGLFGGCFGWGGGSGEEKMEVEESTGLFIVSKGVDTYLKMLLKDNLMHADLHPGNILLQPGLSHSLRLLPRAACVMRGPMRGPRWWWPSLWVRACGRRAGLATGTWEPARFSQAPATRTRADVHTVPTHADVHTAPCAGAAERGRSPRIVLVDAGMVAQLSSSEQVGFARGRRGLRRGVSCTAAHTPLHPLPAFHARVLLMRDRTKDFPCTDARV